MASSRPIWTIERLPSGKFATNALVLLCAILAYNILRWIGQTDLAKPGGPARHRAKRRWIHTVMQKVMYLAARFIEIRHRLRLSFGRHLLITHHAVFGHNTLNRATSVPGETD